MTAEAACAPVPTASIPQRRASPTSVARLVVPVLTGS
jgi:hypothetical protein